LKPSNILVDASGQPKLLDFGIAKLLSTTVDATQTVDRLLTPNYASPEQLRGSNQTTATDVYSLGAVLYKLLTGRSPHESNGRSPPALEAIAGARDIAPPSRLNPAVPSDIDYVLRKALRYEPEERYVSVDALANDVSAFLDSRPVAARSGDAWYRTRKFLRRYWLPVATAAIVVTALAVGFGVANHQRAIAQRRFHQVRHLANKVLALDEVVRGLPGSTNARLEIVAISKDYLESLLNDARADQDLALEIGIAYAALAKAEGVPGGQNLGRYAAAEESLNKAQALIEPAVTASPQKRQALLALVEISQGRMSLARQTGRPNEEILAHARLAASRMDTLLAMGTLSQAEARRGAVLFYSIALAHRNMHLHEDAIRYARRSTELNRMLPLPLSNLTDGLSLLADLMRIAGDFQGALEAIRAARTTLEGSDLQSERRNRNSWFLVLWREGVILGGGGGLNLNRPDEAIVALQRAFDVIEEWAQEDASDASIRILFDQCARELGAILREREPQRALAVYDHARRRLSEIRDNARARRGEAGLLAGSSYALRRLSRTREAKERIDTALRLLRETKDYPADRITTDSEAEPVLRALADHYADTGQPHRATEIYQELLSKILASKPEPANDLRHATKISRIYGALTDLHRRNRRPDQAEGVARLRRELWRQWADKLPGNAFVQRQLEASR
ncbi:MAG: protein kinase domain-containing protein, partial [Bryobacteraceae bacterium]